MKPRQFTTRAAAQSYGQRTLGGLNTDFGVAGPDKAGKFYSIAWLRPDQGWMAYDLSLRGMLAYPNDTKTFVEKK